MCVTLKSHDIFTGEQNKSRCPHSWEGRTRTRAPEAWTAVPGWPRSPRSPSAPELAKPRAGCIRTGRNVSALGGAGVSPGAARPEVSGGGIKAPPR